MNKEEKQKILGIIEQLDGKQYLDSGEIISLKIELKHAMLEESVCDLCGAPLDKQGNEYWRKQIAKRKIEEYCAECMNAVVLDGSEIARVMDILIWLDTREEA